MSLLSGSSVVSTSLPSTLQPEAFSAEDMERAFEGMKPEIDALALEDCPPVTTDVDLAAATVLAAVPCLAPHEPQLRALPEIGASLDKLRPYALGVMHAQVRVAMADRAMPTVHDLEALVRLREMLVADLTPFVQREIIDGALLAQLNTSSGYRNAANDVLLLASIAERHWPSIGHRTPMTPESLDEARKAATEMLGALVVRDGRVRASEVSGERVRAFTLLVRAYDDVRRGVIFLLSKKGDAAIDAVTPSLFRGRGGRGKAKDESVEPEVANPVTGSPVTGNPVTGSPQPVAPTPSEGPGVRPF